MISSQFPTGFQAAQLPGSFGNANFANFRPQYSVPGQNNPSQGFPGMIYSSACMRLCVFSCNL